MTNYTTTSLPLRPGYYTAVLFIAFEHLDDDGFEDGLDLCFEITEDRFNGNKFMIFSYSPPSVGSRLCDLLAMLEGEKPRSGITRDLQDYAGKTFTIELEEQDNNGSMDVSRFKPAEDGDSFFLSQ